MSKWITLGWLAMLAITGCAVETGTEPGAAAGATDTPEHTAAGQVALTAASADAKIGTASLGRCPSGPERMQCARSCYVRFHDETAVDACVDACNACW